MRFALLSLLAVLVAVNAVPHTGPAASNTPYTIDDVDHIDFKVVWTDNAVTPITFTLNTKLNTAGQVTLGEGEFHIEVTGFTAGNAEIFYGESGLTSITPGTDNPTAITIVALDTQTYATARSTGVSFSPIIQSLTIVPTIVRVGADTVLTVTALDPTDDEPTYEFVIVNHDALIAVDGTTDTDTCPSGTSCAVTYTAGADDEGFLDFTFTAKDNGATDPDTTVSGTIAIDRTSVVQFETETWFIPRITGGTSGNGVDPMDLAGRSIAFGDTLTFTITVNDPDAEIHSEAFAKATLSYTVSNTIHAWTNGGALGAIACDTADLSQPNDPVITGRNIVYTIEWTPTGANAAGNNGESFCEFTFQVTDTKGLLSQVVKTNARVTDNQETIDSSTALQPYFNYIYISTNDIVSGETFTISTSVTDPDSGYSLTIEADDTNLIATAITDTAADCHTAACTKTVNIIAGTAAVDGNVIITITATDPVNNYLKDIRTITVNFHNARRRREEVSVASVKNVSVRRAAAVANQITTFTTTITLSGNVLSASMGNVAENVVVASFTPRRSDSNVSTVIAAAAGSAVAIGLIAAAILVVRRRKNTERSANVQMVDLHVVDANNESTA